MKSETQSIRKTDSRMTVANWWVHFLARIGFRRIAHRVEPGLYAIGKPTAASPVFVTANYTLSFDALRSSLSGVDGYLLVLDTHGINVWCAAGKKTFSTQELLRRIKTTNLEKVVSHRRLILPQLGAAGVAAHLVKKESGFIVEYGPVRARDLQEYLKNNRATPEMRRVSFTLLERLVLIPIEFVHVAWITLLICGVLYFTTNWMLVLATLTSVLTGSVLFPLLLPYLPTPNFSTKGLILGALVMLPFLVNSLLGIWPVSKWLAIATASTYPLLFMPVTAFIALNFTGSTTFTSRTGVRREIFAYVPVMTWMFAGGLIISLITILWS